LQVTAGDKGMNEQVKIKLLKADGTEHEFWTLDGKRLWDSLADSGMDIDGSCGGNGLCGKCKLRVEGDTNPISDKEREYLLPEEIKQGFRLACYCNVHAPLKVYLDYSGQEHAASSTIPLPSSDQGPALIQVKQFFIPGMDNEEPVSLHRRLRMALPSYDLDLNMDNLAFLSRLDRSGRPSLELRALVHPGNRVQYIGSKSCQAFGIALDIGTTTIFAALLDLQKKQTVAVISRSNLQKTFGADIVARLSYALDNPDGLQTLRRVLINSINGCLEEMTLEVGIGFEDIYAFSVVGNPVMLHFFLGLNPAGFAAAPYLGLFSDQLTCSARTVGLHAAQEAECYILPQIGGFVGADTVAALLSIPMDQDHTYLLVDIGTNGEIVLKHQEQMWAASAAAGPAFEGGGITCGMRAGEGAIDRVFPGQGSGLEFNVLGNDLPRGLCGSAVIDLLAYFLETGLINKHGIISGQESGSLPIDSTQNGDQIVLLGEEQTAHGLKITINQEDIRQIQLAKAAIRSAIDSLLNEAGVGYGQIDCIYLAGSFGNYINPVSALRIGLLPQVPVSAIKSIGNAAGLGAMQVLLSSSLWERAGLMSEKIRHIEIAKGDGFQELFLSQIDFPGNEELI
jgi:uncharacterized 2Fe-2S/4Fe-4S cluster protein (DUF4445 family)